MRDTIGLLLLVGWFGFWVWLRLARPESFRRAHDTLQGAFDKAAQAGADALHRAVKPPKKPTDEEKP
jgi:hypothetical protein